MSRVPYDRVSIAMTLVVFAITAAVTGISYHEFQNAIDDEYFERSAEWCDERNGNLEVSRVVGGHGGLHCHLQNGTSIHMSEIEEVGAS